MQQKTTSFPYCIRDLEKVVSPSALSHGLRIFRFGKYQHLNSFGRKWTVIWALDTLSNFASVHCHIFCLIFRLFMLLHKMRASVCISAKNCWIILIEIYRFYYKWCLLQSACTFYFLPSRVFNALTVLNFYV